jgi:UDP-N-acetylglucosamine--dolichyl-phosphate N-acetylglucosaminephosphotransferase
VLFDEKLHGPTSGYYRVVAQLIVMVGSFLGLIQVEKTETETRINNLTLLNLILVRMGPMREDQLCSTVLFLQFLGTVLALFVRYGLVHVLYWD